MWGLLLVLLGIWLVIIVFGALIKGLFWLVIVGAVLFLATAAYGWGKTKLGRGPKSISR
ncbi:MAG: hypothetical protein M3R66_16535 [Actinomycetota bacterium]|nr:hypothetical protein [Actinomycetota bacterium]